MREPIETRFFFSKNTTVCMPSHKNEWGAMAWKLYIILVFMLYKNYHKISCFKQHLFISSWYYRSKVQWNRLVFCSRAEFFSGGFREIYASQLIQVVGRNIFPLLQNRGPHSYYFPAAILSCYKLSAFLTMWSLPYLKLVTKDLPYVESISHFFISDFFISEL